MTERARLIVRKKLIELLDSNCGYVEEQKAEELADYLLENEVIALPVMVGDTVYVIPKYNGKSYCGVQQDKVQMVGITSRGIHIKPRNNSKFNKTYILGKTVFLTKEEAEKALNKITHA